MRFVHPWILAGLPVVVAWAFWEWKKTDRHGAVILKALLFGLAVAALADPKLTVFEQRVSLVVLTDRSASIPREDVRKESDLVTKVRSASGRNHLDVIPFSNNPTERSTNLESAIRNAIGRMPEGRVGRLLLVSDGQENAGSVERAAYQARMLGVPVDTYALEGTQPPALKMESIALPPEAFSGEKFPIEMVVASPRASSASVELTAEGKEIGRSEVKLAEGRNTLRIKTQIEMSGAALVTGIVTAPDLGRVRFDRVVALRRPRALLVTAETPDSLRHILQVLDASKFDVTQTKTLPADLRDFQVVVVVNQDLEAWDTLQKKKAEEFVREGGGFALIAGENNVYVEHKQEDDPLQKMLPAKLTPPRTPESVAVVLIVDKSSSMEGKKIELARLSAIGVVENLRPIDQVGLLIFDNSYQWAVPMRRADNPATIKRLIAGITPEGGTQIAPALSEAYRQIRQVKAVYKHIVLLTDGISEEGDSMALSKEAAANQVTISTIGLGQDVNRVFLEKVASQALGKSYFVLDYSSLEQLLLRDVMEHTGSSAIEKPAKVTTLRDAEILEDVGMSNAPPLLGYLKFLSKPQAETILQIDGRDPLLARWQYALGRSVVFSSDAKARWAVNWVTWPGFDKLWTNVLRDLLPRTAPSEATAEFDSVSNEIRVHYRLRPGEDQAPPQEVYALGANGFRKAVPLKRIAASSYLARVPVGAAQGLFRIRPSADLSKFPEVGLYREETELTQFGSNPELLKQIAQTTGGRFNPDPRQVFDPGKRSVTTTLDLWPGLLALAILLNLAELAARKGYSLAKLWNR